METKDIKEVIIGLAIAIIIALVAMVIIPWFWLVFIWSLEHVCEYMPTVSDCRQFRLHR